MLINQLIFSVNNIQIEIFYLSYQFFFFREFQFMAFILLKHQSIFELSIELTKSHCIYDNFVLGNGTEWV